MNHKLININQKITAQKNQAEFNKLCQDIKSLCTLIDNKTDGYRLLMDMGGTNFRVGIADLNGNFIENSILGMKVSKLINSTDSFINVISTVISTVTNNSSQTNFVFSIAGPVSQKGKVLEKYTNGLNEKNIPVADLIEKAVKQQTGKEIDFAMLNDGAAGTIGEMGAGGILSDAKFGFAWIIGTGNGGAAATRDNKGYIEVADAWREIGHHRVKIDGGHKCGCGAVGCLETETSGKAIDRIFKEFAQENPDELAKSELNVNSTGFDISEAVKNGDAFALKVLSEATKYIAIKLSDMWTSTPDMKVAFIGGVALGYGDAYLESVKNNLLKYGVPFMSADEIAAKFDSSVKLGKYHPDNTNMAGDRQYLYQMEQDQMVGL